MPWMRALGFLLTYAWLFALLAPHASAQQLQEMEQEFIELADLGRRSCVRVEVARPVPPPPKASTGQEPPGESPEDLELLTTLSGILLDAEGHVATLADALEGATRVWVSYFDGIETKRFKAAILGYELESNVGLLHVLNAPPFEVLPLGDSETVRPGCWVAGLGYTYNLGPSPSFSVGIVNATDRAFRFKAKKKKLKNLIQTTLDLRPGETGGPVINTSREVVGLLLTSFRQGIETGFPVRSGTSVGYFRQTFSEAGPTIILPINRVKEEVEWILAQEQGSALIVGAMENAPWVGFTAEDISDDALRKQLRIPAGGVLISYIFPHDPADRAGMKENDVLKSWNRVEVEGIDHLKNLIGDSRVGEKITVVLIREGKELQLEVSLGKF